jgi:hypothetical protein
MNRLKMILGALFLLGLLNGCGGANVWPKTPQEYRDGIQHSAFGKKESFVVDRSYATVASLFQRNSRRCLNKTFKVTSTTYGGPFPTTSTNIMAYRAKFRRGATRSTLSIKENSSSLQESGVTAALYGAPPKDGTYVFVVDLKKIGSGKTQVDIYRPSILIGIPARQNTLKAIKAWANGTSRACPNLAE